MLPKMNVLTKCLSIVSLGVVLASCGGGGAGSVTPAGPFLLLIEGGNRLIRLDIDTGIATGLVEGLTNPKHVRISPDGTKYLAQVNGVLVLGSTSSAASTPLTGYKLGDWQLNGTRILAVTNANVVTQLNSTGTSALETVFNGNFGGGISAIDACDAVNQFVIQYNVTGWAQLAKVGYVGGPPTFITSAGVDHFNPRWSPNGLKIAAQSGIGAAQNVVALNADATGLTSIANTSEAEFSPVFSTNTNIYYSRGVNSNASLAIFTMTDTGASQAAYYQPSTNVDVMDVYIP